jgi:hypothetical protein
VGNETWPSIDEVITEVGSAMFAEHRKPARVLADPTALTVVSVTATVPPASGENTSKRPFRQELGGCWSPVRARSMTIWSGT